MMKKLVVNGRDFGDITLHEKSDDKHSFQILDGQATVIIPVEHIKTCRSNYNYSIQLKHSGNYVYQIVRKYLDGTIEPVDGVYRKEADALERARLSTRAYQTDFWKGSKYYQSEYHVVAVEY